MSKMNIFDLNHRSSTAPYIKLFEGPTIISKHHAASVDLGKSMLFGYLKSKKTL